MGHEHSGDGTILSLTSDGKPRLDIDLLKQISRRPRPFSGRERNFWADPYIAEHVLNAHLDPASEVASREDHRIRDTVSFIRERSGVEDARVLDLGCGPGLYSTLLASSGCRVTGIDISPTSIAYARETAHEAGINIDYRCDDFLAAPFDGPYDLIVQIYGEFCTFSPAEQKLLLRKIRSALAPGGMLAFDVFTRRYVERIRGGNDWHTASKDGFWQEAPHLVLEQTFAYPERSTSVVRYTVVSDDGSYRQFCVWWRHFTPEEIRRMVSQAGFTEIELYGSLWGASPSPDDEWIGVFCR